MKTKFLLILLLLGDASILLFQVSQLSISYYETLFLTHNTFLSNIINFSLNIIPNKDFALRIPIIFLHLLSSLLLFAISKKYIQKDKDRLWLVLIFILLPGVISSAIVVNEASLIIFGLFLFAFIDQKQKKYLLYPLLLSYAFIAQDFVYLFLSLIFYALYSKNKQCLFVNTTALLLSLYNFTFIIKGIPSNHFLDLIGIYSAVFSPIIFLYIFYVLYRRYLLKDIDKIWFIASFVLLYSFILSFRQHIYIEHYAPYIMLALPLAANSFLLSYYVRLKKFRKSYKIIFTFSLVLLILNSIIVLYNKEIYPFLKQPSKHFAYTMHIAKELANELHKNNINCINTTKKMQPRLKFYNIDYCKTFLLQERTKISKPFLNVEISYKNKIVYKGYVTKINNPKNDLIAEPFIEDINK